MTDFIEDDDVEFISEDEVEEADDCFEFHRKKPLSSSASIVPLVFGILAILVGIFGFAIALVTSTSQFTMHMMTTVPFLAGIAMISSALANRKAPQSIAIDAAGLRIRSATSDQFFEWKQIAWSRSDNVGMTPQRQLQLLGSNGRVLVKLPDVFANFDKLERLIRERIGSSGDVAASELIRRKASRKNAWICTFSSLLLGAAGVFIIIETKANMHRIALLEGATNDVEGVTDELLTAPNGVTRRLRYHVEGENGVPSEIHNVEVEPAYWEQLHKVQHVPVVVSTEDINVSRLAYGEIADDEPLERSPVGYLMGGVAAVIAVVLSVAAVVLFLGYEITNENGRIQVQRV
ncbi:MAG: hypothetical protein KDA96_05455 [Planctomycetaceae bacterium]|nr:hypothetical protein [Planctomycetaceae bacterium]